MKIIVNNIIPFKGFACIMLFGFLFSRKSNLSVFVINHERIHFQQFKECTFASFFIIGLLILFGLSPWFILLVPFTYYIWYVVEWFIRLLCALITIYKVRDGGWKNHFDKPYRNLLMEREAYSYECKLDYLNERKFFAWLRV